MKKVFLLLLVFTYTAITADAQSGKTITINDGDCQFFPDVLTYDATLNTGSGSTLRYGYSKGNVGSNPTRVTFVSSRWEIHYYANPNWTLLAHSTVASRPNPPSLSFGSWVNNTSNINYCSPLTAFSGTGTQSVLPVELMSFDAQTTEGGKTQLTWATGNEVNSNSFDIERSQDGKTFAPIGTVKAQGKAANYSFVDNTPLSNTSYYRLKSIDNDQTFEYSKVISVQQGKGKTAIHIYPTTTQNVLTVENNGAAVDVVTVFNQVGQLVFTAKQVNQVDMSALPAGMYLVQVQAGSERVTEKVFKQ
jgi:Secretion system C-terminal sorting domain